MLKDEMFKTRQNVWPGKDNHSYRNMKTKGGTLWSQNVRGEISQNAAPRGLLGVKGGENIADIKVIVGLLLL